MFNVNLMTPIMLTRKLLPRLLSRGSKSAIITMSDNEALSSIQNFTNAYGVTKNALIYFMCSLKHEYSNKIDFLTLTPLKFSSKRSFYAPFGLDKVGPQDCVRSALKSLGNVSMSYGNWKHEIWGPLFNNIHRGLRMPTWGGIKERLGFKIKTN